MGLGTLTVSVFRMAVKLAISPSNILLACQEEGGGRARLLLERFYGDVFSRAFVLHRAYPDCTQQTAFLAFQWSG